MSTRCNIVITDGTDKLIFYRHSDGYPEVTGESLKKFCEGYNNHLRNNVSQSTGFLIIQGREEMLEQNKLLEEKYKTKLGNMYGWKVGYYEPTTSIHGDIDFLYEIDIKAGVMKTYSVPFSGPKKLVGKWNFPVREGF